MDSWYKVTLPLSATARLQDAFASVFMANGAPVDAAMFGDENDLRNAIFYFSPGAFRIAGNLLSSYKAVKCSRPLQGSVALLVGDQSALYTLPAPTPDNS